MVLMPGEGFRAALFQRYSDCRTKLGGPLRPGAEVIASADRGGAVLETQGHACEAAHRRAALPMGLQA